MQIHPLLFVLFGFIGVVSGRLLFRHWFNHLTLYSAIWGTGLALFEWRLIDYTPLTFEVWLIILYAWLAFALGSALLMLAPAAADVPDNASRTGAFSSVRSSLTALERRLFVVAILALSTVALLAVLYQWKHLIEKFGGIIGVLINGRTIYSMTVAGKLSDKIPYLDSLSLAAVFLTGLYSARAGKVKGIIIFPLAAAILGDIAQGGRVKILLSGLLFLSAYFLTKHASSHIKNFRPASKIKQILALSFLLAFLWSAAEFVRSYRGAVERFYGASTALNKLEKQAFITPSIYLYLSSHVGVFNAYWKAGGEPSFPGATTFAPVYRILSRVGVAEETPYFQKFYNIPIATNTGTYLRELHSDFGIAGILLTPFLLGFICTALWLRVKKRMHFATIALLAHFYVVVMFTFLYQVTRLGELAVCLIVSLTMSSLIHFKCHGRFNLFETDRPAKI